MVSAILAKGYDLHPILKGKWIITLGTRQDKMFRHTHFWYIVNRKHTTVMYAYKN
jgi:hypothetical protein